MIHRDSPERTRTTTGEVRRQRHIEERMDLLLLLLLLLAGIFWILTSAFPDEGGKWWFWIIYSEQGARLPFTTFFVPPPTPPPFFLNSPFPLFQKCMFTILPHISLSKLPKPKFSFSTAIGKNLMINGFYDFHFLFTHPPHFSIPGGRGGVHNPKPPSPLSTRATCLVIY